VSHSSATRPVRNRILPVSRRSRRRPVFLELESLETRQLLSVASVDLNQIVAQPSKGRKPGWGAPRSDRALRPRVRRWSLVPR